MQCILLLLKYTLFSEQQKRKADELPTKLPPKKKSGVKQPVSRYTNLEEAKNRKRSVIQIRNEDNGMCCASAIIMALERYGCCDLKEKSNKYQKYRNANQAGGRPRPGAKKEFATAARYLHELAGNNIYFAFIVIIFLLYLPIIAIILPLFGHLLQYYNIFTM